MGTIEKMCVICGEDCSTSPRTKDKKGRYYHQACHERAKQDQAARQAVAAASPPPPALEDALSLEPDTMSMLDDLVDIPSAAGADACPSCGQSMTADAMICLNCGYSVKGGKKASTKVKKPKKQRDESDTNVIGYLRNPLLLSVAYLVLFVVLLLVMEKSSEPDLAGVIWALMFFLQVITAAVMVLFNAFRTGIVMGLLTFFVPFYVLYFVYAVCDSQAVKCMFSVSLVSQLIWLVIAFANT